MAIQSQHAGGASIQFVKLMTLTNIALTLAVLGLWTYLAPYIAEPLSEAMKVPLPSNSRPDFIDPGYAAVWLAPVTAIVLANASISASWYRLARWIAAFPLVMLVFTLVWYYGFSATYS